MGSRIRLRKTVHSVHFTWVSIQDPVSNPYRHRNGMKVSATQTGHSIHFTWVSSRGSGFESFFSQNGKSDPTTVRSSADSVYFTRVSLQLKA
jgi:hypothetical protein